MGFLLAIFFCSMLFVPDGASGSLGFALPVIEC